MKDIILQFPINIKKFKKHYELKDKILNAIEGIENPKYSNITRSDWETARFDFNKEWFVIFKDDLDVHMYEWCFSLGYDKFHCFEMWFQQYANGSQHGWHIHGDHMTAVYYLDLPKDSPKTEWINPMDNTVNQFDVEEGDIIIFPSWIVHRAPINESNNMKTIISWNFNLDNHPAIMTIKE